MSEVRHGVSPESQTSGSGVGETIQEQASQAKEKGTHELRAQIDERTTQAGRQVRSLAGALRSSGREVQAQDGNGATARVTSGLADRLERAGGYLEQARGDDLLRGAERFARRRPWLVVGAAAAAGFAASRFVKASSEQRFEDDTRASGLGKSGSYRMSGQGHRAPGAEHPAPPSVTVGPTGSAPAH